MPILAERSGRGAYKHEVVGEFYRETDVQRVWRALPEDGGCEAELRREPDNPHDANAVSVCMLGVHVGYLDRETAATFASQSGGLGCAFRCRGRLHLWVGDNGGQRFYAAVYFGFPLRLAG